MLFATSINGKNVRLSDERWVHIVEGHPEMAGHRNNVLQTITDPGIVLAGAFDELLAARYVRQDKVLVVVFKENKEDGFILTEYFTTKTEKLLNGLILWKK